MKGKTRNLMEGLFWLLLSVLVIGLCLRWMRPSAQLTMPPQKAYATKRVDFLWVKCDTFCSLMKEKFGSNFTIDTTSNKGVMRLKITHSNHQTFKLELSYYESKKYADTNALFYITNNGYSTKSSLQKSANSIQVPTDILGMLIYNRLNTK